MLFKKEKYKFTTITINSDKSRYARPQQNDIPLAASTVIPESPGVDKLQQQHTQG
jgi:hypothetical protein